MVGIAVGGALLELIGAGIPAYVYLATAALAVATWKIGPPAPHFEDQLDVMETLYERCARSLAAGQEAESTHATWRFGDLQNEAGRASDPCLTCSLSVR